VEERAREGGEGEEEKEKEEEVEEALFLVVARSLAMAFFLAVDA
jgi:hypothetical protein